MKTELESHHNSISPLSTSWILLTGAALGLLADQLIGTVGPVGIGFLVWTILFAVTLCWLTRASRVASARPVILWSITAVAAATMMLFRNVPIILLALLLVMAVCMAMVLLHLGGRSLLESELAEHLKALVILPIQSGLGTWPLLGNIDYAAGLKHHGLWSSLRGALLALPLLLVFTGLFSSADASFERLVDRFFNLVSTDMMRHLVLTVLFAWLTTGSLACAQGNRYFPGSQRCNPLTLGSADTAVLMGSLVALFLVFVCLQLGYLFGGRETIEATHGLTLASYARRGFFELLAVAGFTLLVLIAVAGSGCNKRIFRPLAALLTGCVLIIQASAIQRLWLYIEQFGLTIDRLTALAVLGWVTAGIVLFAATLLRGRTRLFAAGLTLSGVTVIFLLALANPGALVTRVNIDRAAANQDVLDIQHLLDLGSDAVPALIAKLDKLPVPQRCQPVVSLYSAWYDRGAATLRDVTDWRGWTYSRSRAAEMISDYEGHLKELTGPCLLGEMFIDLAGQTQFEVVVGGTSIRATDLYSWINDS